MDTNITDDEYDTLRDDGAAPELLAVLRADPESVGINRHSNREAARKHLNRRPDGLHLETVGGDHFAALWNGDLAEAFYHADGSNTRLLLSVFGEQYIVERLIADDNRDPEVAARMVGERVERYGDGLTP